MSVCVSDFRMRLCGLYQNKIDATIRTTSENDGIDKIRFENSSDRYCLIKFSTEGSWAFIYNRWPKKPVVGLTLDMLAAEWAGRWNPRHGLSDLQMSSSGRGSEDGTEPSQDKKFWENIDFVFYIKSPKSNGETDLGKMLDDNVMAAVFPDMDATGRLSLLSEVITSRRFVVLVDEVWGTAGPHLRQFIQTYTNHGCLNVGLSDNSLLKHTVSNITR